MCRRVRGHHLHHHDRGLRSHVVPVVLDPVPGVPVGRARHLVDHMEGGARAATPMLGIEEELGVPEVRRASEEAGSRAAAPPRRPAGSSALRLVELDEPDRAGRDVRQPERAAFAGDVDPHAQRAKAIAEALVDAALRRPQDCERLAALVDGVELEPHHPAQDAAAAMGRVDADDRDAGRRQHAAGDRQFEARRCPRCRRSARRRRRRSRDRPRRSVAQFARSSSRGRSLKASSPATKKSRGSPLNGRTSISMRRLWRGGLLYPRADVPDRRRERARPRPCVRDPGPHRPQRPRLRRPPGSREQPGRRRVHVRLQRRPARDHDRRRPDRARADHGRRPDPGGPAGAGAEPDLADAAHQHLHARRLAAPRRQHALPVGLRRQRRAPRRARLFLAFYLLAGVAPRSRRSS